MIDILLVNPREEGGFFEKMPPIGIAYVAANLEKHGYVTRITDFEVEDEPLEHWLDLYQPRYLGISGTSHTRFESFRLASEAKHHAADITVLYGGVHASFTGANTLKHIPEVDYVVYGEGENTSVALLDAISSGKKPECVRGICFREGGDVIQTAPAQRIAVLDELPMPAYNLLDMNKYSLDMDFIDCKGISLLTSRGCNGRCSFCSASEMFGHKVTTHSAVRILDEVEFLFDKYAYKGVKVFDSTFTIKRNHVNEFCEEISARHLDFPWECEIRIGTVDGAMLEKMYQAGCYYVSFGIESGSQRVLDAMRKGISIEQAVEVLGLCKDIGMRTKVFFSFGHIDETMVDVGKTFAFLDEHADQIDTLACGAGVRIYPGTFLEEYAREKGFLPLGFEWSLPFDEPRLEHILQTRSIPVLVQPQLGYDQLEQVALEIYSRRFKGWHGFKYGIRKITDKQKLKKFSQIARIKLKNIMKRHR